MFCVINKWRLKEIEFRLRAEAARLHVSWRNIASLDYITLYDTQAFGLTPFGREFMRTVSD